MTKEVLLQKELLSEEKLDKELNNCLKKINNLMKKTKDTWFLSPNCNDDGIYELIEHNQWTCSFYTGMLWCSYEFTNDKLYLDLAKKHTLAVDERLKKGGRPANNHDLGFIYSLSAIYDYELTKDENSLRILKCGADKLLTRYIKNAEIIQAWGYMDEEGENQGRIIIDTYMNLPFLFKASILLNDDTYKDAAIKHAFKATKYLVRDDYKTYHTYHFDVNNGDPIKTSTHQGLNDNSCWARGQAWAIYGLILLFKYTKDDYFLKSCISVLNKFIELLSDDGVSFWDFDIDDYKDSSAMAITICGILELSNYIKDNSLNKLASILTNILVDTNYISYDEKEDGILKHGMYHYHKKFGVDNFVSWGDYFYFEALIRLKKKDKFKCCW